MNYQTELGAGVMRNLKRNEIRVLKRTEAEARAVERSKRSVAEQLALLDARGFAAVKERKRLTEGSND